MPKSSKQLRELKKAFFKMLRENGVAAEFVVNFYTEKPEAILDPWLNAVHPYHWIEEAFTWKVSYAKINDHKKWLFISDKWQSIFMDIVIWSASAIKDVPF